MSRSNSNKELKNLDVQGKCLVYIQISGLLERGDTLNPSSAMIAFFVYLTRIDGGGVWTQNQGAFLSNSLMTASVARGMACATGGESSSEKS